MKLNKTPDFEIFETWNPDNRTKIVLLREANALTLLIEPPFGAFSSLNLSSAEAVELGADIQKLLPASPYGSTGDRDFTARKLLSTHRLDAESGLTITVNDINKGEPYEDGISIEFMPEKYNDSICLDFGFSTAADFSKALAGKA